MSYRCQLCGDPVPPKRPRRVITKYRTVRDRVTSLQREEIASETPVCDACANGKPKPAVIPSSAPTPPKPQPVAPKIEVTTPGPGPVFGRVRV